MFIDVAKKLVCVPYALHTPAVYVAPPHHYIMSMPLLCLYVVWYSLS